MLVTLAATASRSPRAAGRYDAWTGALRALRSDAAAPTPGRVRDLLASIPEDQREEAAFDLLEEALRLAWRHAPAPPLAAWLAPGRAPDDALLDAEFAARHQPPHGDAPLPTDPARLLAGGRFILTRRLGAGAMGEVWEARDVPAGRLVAVKRARSPEGEERIRAEAAAVAGLEHRGVAAARETGTDGEGRVFGVMPLASGRTLAELAAEVHRDGAEARGLFAHVLEASDAVAHAHERGVLHRDLKADHVVPGAGVIDWGFARRVALPDGLVAGTPECMAPEQAEGRDDERSDVFGLGGLLFHALTGAAPRAWPGGARPSEWRELVRSVPVRSPAELRPGVPRWLADTCRRALAHDPARRHANAAAFRDDLRARLAPRSFLGWLGLGPA